MWGRGDLVYWHVWGEFLGVHHCCQVSRPLVEQACRKGSVSGLGRQGLLNAEALDSPTGTGRRLLCVASKPDTRSSGQKRGAPTAGVRLPELQRLFGGPEGALGQGQGLPTRLPTRVRRGFHRLRWAMWPPASGGARPLPSPSLSPVSQTGLRDPGLSTLRVHGYWSVTPVRFPNTHTPGVTLDKLWNLSETADTPKEGCKAGLQSEGLNLVAQQPGDHWREGRPGHSGNTEAQILCWEGHGLSAPQGPQSSACWGAAAGTQEVLRKHPPALSSCSLQPHGQTSSHVSSSLTALRGPSTHPDSPTSPGKGVPKCPSPPCPEARLPLHAHLPLRPQPTGPAELQPGAQLVRPLEGPSKDFWRNKAFSPGQLHSLCPMLFGLPQANGS